MEIKVLKNILSANDQRAKENRELLNREKIFALNITASPGAGKTSLILATITALKETVRIGVVEGDVSSTIDAERVSKEGIPVVQINTGGGCHLNATMFANALASLPLPELDLLLIENVGNLICPAAFALGEHRNVLIASVPEGDDKPYKYPVMFSQADLVVLNKIDLQAYVAFTREKFTAAVRGINDTAPIIELSCRSGDRVDEWTEWLLAQMKDNKSG